jgi:DnaK suppressor protein
VGSKTTGKKTLKARTLRSGARSMKAPSKAASKAGGKSAKKPSGKAPVAARRADKIKASAAASKSAPRASGSPKAAPGLVAANTKPTVRKGLGITIKTPPRIRPVEKKPPAEEAMSKTLTFGRGKKTRTVAEVASTAEADNKGYVFINGRRVRMISTKGQTPIKKVRDNGATGTASQPPAEAAEIIPIKSIKTKLSRKELSHYRELLLLKRRELVGDLNAMETEALRSGGGNISHMPIHMADIGTDTYDQDFMLGLAAAERDQLREIDQALARIEDRTYGVCQLTGKPIPKARLDAKPWAKYTVEAARQMEGGWGS